MTVKYDEDSVKHLEPREHIRRRPGMYIGQLGDGSSSRDGIYILLKEVIDNGIDEYQMGFGKKISITIKAHDNQTLVTVDDNGRGIPLGSLVDCVSKINTGAKYDNSAFQKSVGMNGVGIKAVNALSSSFIASTFREGKGRSASFDQGHLVKEQKIKSPAKVTGTQIEFSPDKEIFGEYQYELEHVERMCKFYSCLNPGITIDLTFNDQSQLFHSTEGLVELIEELSKSDQQLNYELINLPSEPDIHIVLAHGEHYGEEIYSFVNGQFTSDGGTHVSALKDGIVQVIRNFYGKKYEAQDIRNGIVAAISIRIQEPLFESQTKIKLGSTHTEPQEQGVEKGVTLNAFIGGYLKKHLDSFLHKNTEVAEKIGEKIQRNATERKELSGIRDKVRQLAKKNSINNKKLRDCKIHWNSSTKAYQARKVETTLFITEGDSAAGSVTQVRDAEVQAVFTLRGKPFNCFGHGRRAIYENKELYMLQNAIGIDTDLSGLKYNRVVIATDADVDGMHIRMLITTFFLQYHPDLVKEGHLYILQTPLFRVRNQKVTTFCYSEEEKNKSVEKLGGKVEITRFKGLGEISASEFKDFIGKKMRLEPVVIGKGNLNELLKFYMGDNTPERQRFICDNLVDVTA